MVVFFISVRFIVILSQITFFFYSCLYGMHCKEETGHALGTELDNSRLGLSLEGVVSSTASGIRCVGDSEEVMGSGSN